MTTAARGVGGGSFTPTNTAEFQRRFDRLLDKTQELVMQRDTARSVGALLEEEVAAYLPIVRWVANHLCWAVEVTDQPTDDPQHTTPCAHCDARMALSRFDHTYGAA